MGANFCKLQKIFPQKYYLSTSFRRSFEDEHLDLVGDNCPKLSYLDLDNSDVTEDGVFRLLDKCEGTASNTIAPMEWKEAEKKS